MMLTRTRFLIAFLALAIVIVAVALMLELGGTTFRAEDYDGYDECVRSIPTEWEPGSLEHTRAQASCEARHRGSP